jgi:signal transduction histidine kinase
VKTRLIGALVTISAIILFVFSVPLVSFVSKVERERLVTALERDAFGLAGHAKETLNTVAGATLPSLQPFVNEYVRSNDTRAIVTNADGLIIASSDTTSSIGSDYSNRPEVSNALDGTPSVGERVSVTLGQRLVFVAVPVQIGDTVVGVVRLSKPKSVVDKEVRSRILGIVVAGGFTILAAAGVAIPLALGIARPITRLTRRTERLAEGDFTVRADDSDGPPEVRELSRSFNAMASRLGLMIENQRHFAGAVSHQLRTPLTALRLRLEQAQESVEDDSSPLAIALDASRTEADRLQEMVEQLLALARIEGGTAPTVTVNAAEIVRARADMWEPLAAEKNVTVRVLAAPSVNCAVIEGGLEQIIDNYIDNALTVAPTGSEIVVEVQRVGTYVVVDVVDHGPGLTEEQRDLAFERFWRGKNTENAAGTGLGLAIVRQLAAASGGTVELLARADGASGACARVSLLAR